MEPVLIFDADSVKYSVSAVIQKRDEEGILRIEPAHHAYHNITTIIDNICTELQSKKLEVYLTKLGDRTNFRYQYLSTYKANRTQEKPILLNEVHQYIMNKYSAIEAVGEEADDLVSIRQYEMNPLGFREGIKNSVICSIDKDLDTVPGWHYNYRKKQLYFITEIEAKQNFYLQILTGDTSDNVPRIKPRWIKTKAVKEIKALQTEPEMLNYVRAEILKIYDGDINTDDEILWRGRVLHMRSKPGEIWEIPDDQE